MLGLVVTRLPAGWWRVMICGAVALMSVAGLPQGEPARADSAHGSISGQVRVLGQGMADVRVHLFRVVGSEYWAHDDATTGPDGRYVIDDVHAGTYVACVEGDERHESRCWRDAETSQEADRIIQVDGGQITAVDFDLLRPSVLSGRLTSRGEPASDVTVTVYAKTADDWYPQTTVRSSTEGEYAFYALSEGTYRLGFGEAYEGPYLPTFHGGDSVETATDVTVVRSTTTGGVDADLELGGRISGTVRYAGYVPFPQVVLYCRIGGAWLDCDGRYGSGLGDDGSFLFEGLEVGRYRVGFPDDDYVGGFWRAADTVSEADDVVITHSGHHVEGIDLRPQQRTTLTGRFTDSRGQPAEGSVYLLAKGGPTGWTHVRTSEAYRGRYAIQGLYDNVEYCLRVGVEPRFYSHPWQGYPHGDDCTPFRVPRTGTVTRDIEVSLVRTLRDIQRPRIVGRPLVGNRLRADPGRWEDLPEAVSYQWMAGNRRIRGATRVFFTVPARLEGRRLRLVVAATAPKYLAGVARSVWSARVR